MAAYRTNATKRDIYLRFHLQECKPTDNKTGDQIELQIHNSDESESDVKNDLDVIRQQVCAVGNNCNSNCDISVILSEVLGGRSHTRS